MYASLSARLGSVEVKQRVLDRVSLAVQLRGLLVEEITLPTDAEPNPDAE
jgi:hypothetical protein